MLEGIIEYQRISGDKFEDILKYGIPFDARLLTEEQCIFHKFSFMLLENAMNRSLKDRPHEKEK
jgi:hypothetical protein